IPIFVQFSSPFKQMEPERCFESRNTSCLKSSYPIPLRVTLYIILGVIIILTVCGNLLVTFSVAYFKQLHTPTNYLILSLAMSDLLSGIIVMFPFMIQTIESCWYFGDFFCNVYMSSAPTLCTASIITLSFIAVDRYYAVCQPLLYRRKISVNVVLVMILISWSFSVILGFGMIFLKLNILGVEEFYYNHVVCEGGCSPWLLTLTCLLLCNEVSDVTRTEIIYCFFKFTTGSSGDSI
uniref:Trace amine-associated receptor 1 n=1 Tax=Labrus bergylta TaxID=56723 RepID=A0A3Q3E0Q6_9LABR